jgi:hypothetical protein
MFNNNVAGLSGTASEPALKPAAFHALFQRLPSAGLSELVAAIASARPLLMAERNAAVVAVLDDLAASHKDINPGTAGGLLFGPAGVPTSAVSGARMTGSVFCFKPAASPYLFAPSRRR